MLYVCVYVVDLHAVRGLASACRVFSLAARSPSGPPTPLLPAQLLELATACMVFCGLAVQTVTDIILPHGCGSSDGNEEGEGDTGDDEENDMHRIPEYTATALASLRKCAASRCLRNRGSGHGGGDVWENLPLLLAVFQAVDAMVAVLPTMCRYTSSEEMLGSGKEGGIGRGGHQQLLEEARAFTPLLRKRRRTGAREVEEVSRGGRGGDKTHFDNMVLIIVVCERYRWCYRLMCVLLLVVTCCRYCLLFRGWMKGQVSEEGPRALFVSTNRLPLLMTWCSAE